MQSPMQSPKPKVRIVGGGVAGLEAVLALADLAPGLAETTLVTPDPEFVYKPLTIEDAFTDRPAPRYELGPLLEPSGATLLLGSLESVNPGERSIRLVGGEVLAYDALIICVGARPRPAYEGVKTFWHGFDRLAVDELIDEAFRSPGHLLNLVVPPGMSWSLPLYELALMLRLRANARGGREGLRIRLITPEQGPLLLFGREASIAVAGLLASRRIELKAGLPVVDDQGIPDGAPMGEPLPTIGPVVSLPILEGPAIPGLPADPHGFISIGSGCEVPACAGVYAAGDGTTFPLKQGGLATQQADAAAERVAVLLGAAVDAAPFRPVLRGQLLTGTEQLALVNDRGEPSQAKPHLLWLPREKISGRYLTGALRGSAARPDPPPGSRPIEVEVSWPCGRGPNLEGPTSDIVHASSLDHRSAGAPAGA